jgi:hypothetical protein
MAFDHENHYLDEKGFARHKETGHLIGIEAAPPKKHPDEGGEYPKWVVAHTGHIQRGLRGGVSTPEFGEHHAARDGTVSVLVRDEEDELRAISDPKASKSDEQSSI